MNLTFEEEHMVYYHKSKDCLSLYIYLRIKEARKLKVPIRLHKNKREKMFLIRIEPASLRLPYILGAKEKV